MAIPAYLWLKDDGGAAIKGSVQVLGREGSIEVQGFGHNLHIPTDGNTGRLTGNRVHSPLAIEKEFDSSSPYLYKAVMASPLTYIWFYRQVRNNGPWDYKQRGRQYEDFGNFHYGAVGLAAGIPEIVLLRAAGCAQIRAGTWLPVNGVCWRDAPFGDDPNDQRWIKKGIGYASKAGY